jgi:GNAT superfamily N-acetyltransferase
MTRAPESVTGGMSSNAKAIVHSPTNGSRASSESLVVAAIGFLLLRLEFIHPNRDSIAPRFDDMSTSIRVCRRDELTAILAIVNAAAEAYRGVIPADRWHEPYMTRRELESEIAAGVAFWGYEADGALIGVMGIQAVGDVELIRHAYVLPGSQRRGVGGALLEHLSARSERRMLVGTWAAAEWAIDFYRRHGFALASPERGAALLKRCWTIPDRQVETSVVLAKPPLDLA